MNKVVCFGEIMLRLNPQNNIRFLQADKFNVSYAGSEANVAVSLAQFDLNSAYVSKVPNNEIGQASINSLRRFGVDTKFVIRGGERLGVYFVEKGWSQRASKVIYDRKDSAICMANKLEFEWDKIFQDAKWFHFSGITPALGDELAEICLEACKLAKKKGIKVSCDLNYRSKLWNSEKASKVMAKLMEYVDICIANEEDAEKVFKIKGESVDENFRSIDLNSYKYVAKELIDRFQFELVALTLRESISSNKNLWSGLLYDGNEYCYSTKYEIDIVDRVGGGDSFAAGLIYSIINNYTCKKAIDFAVAASCLKHTIEGDFNLTSVDEVEKLISGDGSGRIQR